MYSWQDLDLNQPLNLAHKLNFGRVAWWLALPGRSGGPSWYDLVGGLAMTNSGNVAGFGWSTGSNPGGGGSFKFTGATAYLSAGSANTIQPAKISAAAWVNTTSISGAKFILSRLTSTTPSGWDLSLNSGKPRFTVSNASANASAVAASAIATNAWYRLLGTWDGTTVRVYQNGSQQATASLSGNLTNPAVALEIGNSAGTAGIWPGMINDVSIWSRALSAAEAAQDFYLSQQNYPDVLNWQSWDILPDMGGAGQGGFVPPRIYHRPRFEPALFE